MIPGFMMVIYNLLKNYIGIDISKFNHFTAVISSDEEISIEPFSVLNPNLSDAPKQYS